MKFMFQYHGKRGDVGNDRKYIDIFQSQGVIIIIIIIIYIYIYMGTALLCNMKNAIVIDIGKQQEQQIFLFSIYAPSVPKLR